MATWTLSAGGHTITASVSDSEGLTSLVEVSIFVSGTVIQAVLSDGDRAVIAQHLTPPGQTPQPPPVTAASEPGALPEPPNDQSGSGFPAVPIVVFLLVVLGGGFVLRSRGGIGSSRS